MTVNNVTIYSRIAEAQKKENRKNALITTIRTIASLLIPLTAALCISLFATFVFHANGGANYFYNTWFLFCKLFFPCTPLMMYFIMK